MRPGVYDFDIGAGPNLMKGDILDQRWLENTRQSDMSKVRGASDQKTVVSGSIILHIFMCESRTRVARGVVDKRAVPVLLWTTFIGRFIKLIYLA